MSLSLSESDIAFLDAERSSGPIGWVPAELMGAIDEVRRRHLSL